jgi:large subunit ribosomal protein L7/L12
MFSDKLKKIADQLSELTIVEAAALSKFLEEEWGVTAAAPVAAAGAAAAGGAEEKDEFDVLLVEAGAKKIDVIKLIRSATGLGLVEAKAIADGASAAGAPIKSGMPADEAQKLIDDIAAVGGKAIKK